MKTLIVYYSLVGNTAYAAETIAKAIGADLLRLMPKKVYSDKGFSKFFWGGKSAVMKEKPDLQEYDADLSGYDCLVIGFPVWASRFTPPIRTFAEDNLSELQNKKLYSFACESGSGGEKALDKLSALIGKDFAETAVFIDPKSRQNDDTDRKIAEFAGKIR